MQARAIEGPWAAGERVLTCVSEDPRARGPWCDTPSGSLIACTAPWTALYVEHPAQPQLGEVRARPHEPTRCGWPRPSAAKRSQFPGAAERSRMTSSTMRGKTTSPRSSSANPAASRWFEILHGSVVHDLRARRRRHRACTSSPARKSRASPCPKTVRRGRGPRTIDLRGYAWSAAIVAAAVGLSLALEPFIARPENDRPGLPHCGRRDCRSLRPVAVAVRQPDIRFMLQFLLHPPSTLPSSLLVLRTSHVRILRSSRGDHCFEFGGRARFRNGCSDGPRGDDGSALRLRVASSQVVGRLDDRALGHTPIRPRSC